ncbi:epoxyqueuosine reductase QueH [Bilifractor sp. LCP19S3_H10]|jgi:predicted adenine nucleotide alpha hydrolase (AANH) superfamily ATPase|uniref:epoxyqueuosine reductase QueH n=1 Tax=Bilifractor sp. LCP19S3_H10 TaxID=3438736 RepID=UPI003F90A387
MNQKINYQKEMEKILAELEAEGRTPRLLLHSCCAPCSSYVLEYLSPYFFITDFYYNPNIAPADEYRKRVSEMQRLIREMPLPHPVEFEEGVYDPDRFYEMARGKEDIPEGGERCFACFEMRLREAAQEALRLHMDYFTTSLSISPLKDAQKLNEIGIRLGEEYGVPYLVSDFKKKNGFRRSTELSREYHLYRQNYCGCVYSRRQAEREGRV